MALTDEQQQVLNVLLAEGRKISDPRARRVYNRAAVETGLVESGLTNPSGGDADSAGWRQERASLYPDPTNLQASAARFRQEFLKAYQPGEHSYDVAAQVQRPAAQYRGRYHDVADQAAQILQQYAGGSSPASSSPSSSPSSSSPVQALTGSEPGQGADVSALLAQLSQGGFQKPTASASSLSAPAATAGPALPAAYRALTTSGGPAPKRDISSLLSMVSTPGQAAANALTSQSSLVADASTSTSGSSGGTSGASAGTGGAQAALGWAESKVGFKETGENSGGLASYLNQRFGFSNAPWCAMFTSAAVTKGGAPESARTASVAEVRRQAVNGGGGYRKGFIDPGAAKAGDLILFGDDHVAMVQRVKNGKVFYVGGNQSDGVTESSVAVGTGDIVRPKYGARQH